MSMIIPNLEEIVRADHPYRKLLELVDFDKLTENLNSLYSQNGRGGYAVSQGFRCLFLQFKEDLSDRELEIYLQDSTAAKLFCGFGLMDKVPDHSYFGALRAKIGTHRLAKIFNQVGAALRKQGYVREVFSFVDSQAIHSKVNLWEARDKAKAEQSKKDDDDKGMNNSNVGNYSSDKNARFGCKGKEKYWYGYKNHACVDMTRGMITKTAITPANVTDADGLKRVCPSGGMVLADKAYSTKNAQATLKAHNCHSGAIKKNNMKGKDFRKDKWLTSIRMPFEGTFSKLSNTARYRGLVKVQFQAFFQALCHNISKLLRLNSPPLQLA